MNWYKKHIYANINAYTTSEFLNKLKMFGVKRYRHGKGDHVLFINKNNGKIDSIPVPGSLSKEINPLTMKKIIGNFGIPWDVWKELPKNPKNKEIEKIKDRLPWTKKETDLPSPTTDVAKEQWENQPWAKKYYTEEKEYELV